MRNLNKLTAILVLCAVAFNSCKKDLQDLLENDLVFNMDANAFLQNQVQLHFVNAVGANATDPNPTISISGKDAQTVFDINGSRNIVVANQFANLAVSPGKPLSPNTPAVFKIQATAPGFLPYEQEIQVSHLDSFLNYTFEMVEINNPPAGITTTSSNFDLSTKKALAIGQTKTGVFSGKLQINANTNFLSEEGKEVSGISKIEWRQFDTKNDLVVSNAEHLIPNYSNQVIIDQNISDLAFYPIGFAQLQINSGTTKISKFNQPVQMELSIANGTINRANDVPVKAGDIMGIYHLNSTNKAWELVDETTIIQNAGSLKAIFPVAETGDFAIASARSRSGGGTVPSTTCSSALGLKFTRANNINTLHYIEVVNGSGTILATASDVQVFHDGTYNFSTKLPANLNNVTVKVYQYEKASYKGNVLVTSAAFSSCSKTTTSRLTIAIPTMNTVARFELDTYCANSKLFYYHDGRIQYKVKGAPDNTYRDMGLAKKSGRNSTEIIPGSGAVPVQTSAYSFLETDRLVSGTSYTFRTEISGRHKTSKKTIKQVFTRDRLYNLNNGEFSPYTGTTPGNYNFMKFNKGYWISPTNACAIFGY